MSGTRQKNPSPSLLIRNIHTLLITDRVIDASHCIAIPGLVNSHHG